MDGLAMRTRRLSRNGCKRVNEWLRLATEFLEKAFFSLFNLPSEPELLDAAASPSTPVHDRDK
jgi:hypothetical protein